MTSKTATEHIAAAEKALERAEQFLTSPSVANHYLRVAEVHTQLAAVVQTEAAQDRDRS
jgi:hypothetical protein